MKEERYHTMLFTNNLAEMSKGYYNYYHGDPYYNHNLNVTLVIHY